MAATLQNFAVHCCALHHCLHSTSKPDGVQDCEGTPEESEALLTQQFKLLEACLMDEAPAIRATAVKGVCSLLNVWWEIVPQATLIGFLRRITGGSVWHSLQIKVFPSFLAFLGL